MRVSWVHRVLAQLGQIGPGEGLTAFLMLAYSFLAMASYNIVKPITRSKFIDSLGADNIPYVQLAAGLLIGVIMIGYSWAMGRLPRRWSLPIAQGGIVAVLVGFWFLFRQGGAWVPVLFFLVGLILGILLISQFWTLANLVYDPRQAKRLFGFIGAGAPLGGIAGSLITAHYVTRIGSANLLLVSAALMLLCICIVSIIVRRTQAGEAPGTTREEKGVGGRQALSLLRSSKHLQMIALVISFAAIGATIIEQQLNLAAEATKSQESAIAGFLAEVQAWTSAIGFIVQIFLTSRIHRFLGIGFALMILPISLGSTAMVMLLNAALWAPGMARVIDQSLRYTVDKTTREILFMPLPGDLKIQAKPFVDVTVDRFAKGFAAVLALVLIKPWGLNLNWQQLGYASLAITGIWVFMAVRARRGYLESFRKSIETREVRPSELRLASPDLSTLETLIEELASTDEKRVVYALDLLNALGKRNLVTPLILHHNSAAVRVRALELLSGAPEATAERWLPHVRSRMTDTDVGVRAAAIGALAGMTSVDSAALARPLLEEANPRMALTAAMILVGSGEGEDRTAAARVLERIAADPRDSSVEARLELAAVLRHIPEERFRRLLIPLLTDVNQDVAREALRSVRQLGVTDPLFVNGVVPVLRNYHLRREAREFLLQQGEDVVGILGHMLRDTEEDQEVRRHIPGTLALLPLPKTVEILTESLGDPDEVIRFKSLKALGRIRRHDGVVFDRGRIESEILKECDPAAQYRTLTAACRDDGRSIFCRLLSAAVREKADHAADRIFRLLGLIHPWKDIMAAQVSVQRGGKTASRALEYLDNLLAAGLRRRVLPALEGGVHGGGGGAGTAAGDRSAWTPATLRLLLHDPDPVLVSSVACLGAAMGAAELRPDFERVLARRDSLDWSVSQAVLWALEELDRPGSRHETMPVAVIAARLGSLPVFSGLRAGELFRIASAGRIVRYNPGDDVLDGTSVTEDMQILLEGGVHRPSEGIEIDSPAPLNVEEVLQGVRGKPARANKPSTCLCLSLEDLGALMSGSPEIIEGLFRMLCLRFPEEIAEPVAMPQSRPPAPLSGRLAAVDRVVLFESFFPFQGLAPDDLMALAASATDLGMADGNELFGEMAPPALHFVVSGVVVLDSSDDGSAIEAGAGAAIGLFQMMAGIPLLRRASCRGDCTVLRLEREDFFGLLAERPDLLRQLLGRLF